MLESKSGKLRPTWGVKDIEMTPIPEVRKTEVGKETFLRNTRAVFGLGNVWYPGCGHDTSLETAFKPEDITYLDCNDTTLATTTRNFHFTNVREHTLAPEQFDAVFLQDFHLKRDDIDVDRILAPLKRRGILLLSMYLEPTCPGFGRDEFDYLMDSDQLLPVNNLPYLTNPRILTFRKAETEDMVWVFRNGLLQ